MMINTYGLKMGGLKKASGNTINWTNGGHTQISYNTRTGEILTNDHIGQSWTQYHDTDIITVCTTEEHMTMQEIAAPIPDVSGNEIERVFFGREFLK